MFQKAKDEIKGFFIYVFKYMNIPDGKKSWKSTLFILIVTGFFLFTAFPTIKDIFHLDNKTDKPFSKEKEIKLKDLKNYVEIL